MLCYYLAYSYCKIDLKLEVISFTELVFCVPCSVQRSSVQRSSTRSRRGGISENWIAYSASASLFLESWNSHSFSARPFKFRTNSGSYSPSCFVSLSNSFAVYQSLQWLWSFRCSTVAMVFQSLQWLWSSRVCSGYGLPESAAGYGLPDAQQKAASSGGSIKAMVFKSLCAIFRNGELLSHLETLLEAVIFRSLCRNFGLQETLQKLIFRSLCRD